MTQSCYSKIRGIYWLALHGDGDGTGMGMGGNDGRGGRICSTECEPRDVRDRAGSRRLHIKFAKDESCTGLFLFQAHLTQGG